MKRDWTTSSNWINYSTLDNEHNWEDLHIQFKNPQTHTSHNHNKIKKNLIFNLILANALS
jgi:hypothetical protein